jgi:hypothetical protein
LQRRGSSNATVDDIAAAAGVAKGTVYSITTQTRHLLRGAQIWHRADVLMLGSACSRVDARREAANVDLRQARVFRRNRTSSNLLFEVGNICIHPGTIDNEFKTPYLEQAKVGTILKEGARKRVFRSLRAEQNGLAISDIVRGGSRNDRLAGRSRRTARWISSST